MKLVLSAPLLAMLLVSAASHAQMYKWVGPDGKVTYSDSPPPKTATRVEQKNLSGGGVNTANLPFELAEAVKNHPVTLYTSQKCVPCEDGRKFLNSRGIPFTEKTISSNEEVTRFRELAGSKDAQLPLLTVGRNKETGFEAGAWGVVLNAAGYPGSSKLPVGYRNPAAESLIPAPANDEASKSAQARKPAAPAAAANNRPAAVAPEASGNAPPGFRF